MDTLVSLLRLAGSFARKHLGAIVEVARAGLRWLRAKIQPARDVVVAIVVKLIRRTLGRRAAMPPEVSSVPPFPGATSSTTRTSSSTTTSSATEGSPRSTNTAANTTTPNATPFAWSALIARARGQIARREHPPMDVAV